MSIYITEFRINTEEYDISIVDTALNTIHKRDKSFKYTIIQCGNTARLIVFSRTKGLAKKRGEWIKKNLLNNEVDYVIKERR